MPRPLLFGITRHPVWGRSSQGTPAIVGETRETWWRDRCDMWPIVTVSDAGLLGDEAHPITLTVAGEEYDNTHEMTPDEARELARVLVYLADKADGRHERQEAGA